MFINEQKRRHEKWSYNTDINSLVKQHYIACGMHNSKKLTSRRKYKNSAREEVYTDNQLRNVLFKAMKKQSLPLIPCQIIEIW